MNTINEPAALAAVIAASDAYEAALQSNDVEGLDFWFWQDERVSRLGVDESLYGFAAIQAFRQARAAHGIARSRLRRQIVTFGRHSATVLVEFRRESDRRIGRQTQTWVRLPQGWRIVMAHISLLPEQLETEPPG